MFSILQKPQETVSAEDLESLQNEIERRLVDVVTSKWSLERELLTQNSNSPDFNTATPSIADSQATSTDITQLLCNSAAGTASGTNSTEDSVGSDNSQSDLGSSSGVKRKPKGSSSDRPSKRFRLNNNTNNNNSNPSINSSGNSSFAKRPPQIKHRHRHRFNTIHEESRVKNKKQIIKNEAPDKLWPFVEQFCATPTQEQIETLEEMIKAIDNDKDYYKVPPSISNKKNSPSKTDSASDSSKKGLGALTQRVGSIFFAVDGPDDEPTTETKTKKKNYKPKGGKTVDLNQAKKLEKSIRQGLEEYNILAHQDDIPYNSEDDEFLRNLKANQHELSTIQRQNREYMIRLLKRAKKHIELENEREKLREANADVISAYQKLVQAKQRKRNPTKKEKDAAIKALEIQDTIFKKCDELYLCNLNRNA